MKSKLLIILLLISSVLFGQQVPDTETFTLDTVVKVVNPTTDDLQDCFNDTIAGYFNATYRDSYYAAAGNKLNLLMFRDYGIHNAAAYPTFVGYTTASGTSSITIDQHTNTLVGDVMILIVGAQPNCTVTTPTGWTFLRSHSDVSSSPTMYVFWKVATASGTGNNTSISLSGTTGTSAAMIYEMRSTATTKIRTSSQSTYLTVGSSVTATYYETPLDYSVIVFPLVINGSELPTWSTGEESRIATTNVSISTTRSAFAFGTVNPYVTATLSGSFYSRYYAIEIRGY